ncbi:MAG TPA: hypothetical protein VKQ70_10095 [Caulobacteraceae bacterium]|jgi:hypothetical protein|nr:hypothetical protein [Caulobacteraceae bacterium]
MRRWTIAAAGLLTIGLGGCVGYHQEVAALRMPRPTSEAPGLKPYAAADPAYPTVGGDILKGASPRSEAAYDATVGERVPPPPGQGVP